jgi:hypothetical protein
MQGQSILQGILIFNSTSLSLSLFEFLPVLLKRYLTGLFVTKNQLSLLASGLQ